MTTARRRSWEACSSPTSGATGATPPSGGFRAFYVDAGWRRRGVYRAMYDHVLSMVDFRGDVCGIRLYVERTNTIAQNTYDSLGMHKSHYDLYEMDFTS